MSALLAKYLERLRILKENHANTIETNTDAENEHYESLIRQVAEFCQDLKALDDENITSTLLDEGMFKTTKPLHCQCLHEIENNLTRTKRCVRACRAQYEILAQRKDEKN